VIFSGSSGAPLKGVMIEHGSLLYINWASGFYVGNGKTTFLYTPQSHLFNNHTIFTPLVTGNMIVVYEGTDDTNATIEKKFDRQ
jgi:long-subunit acyl-CoA synthetase (AMP-forming)